MWFIILVSVLIVLVYIKLSKLYSLWKKKGVPHLKPWPIVGNMNRYVFGKCSFTEMAIDLYNAFPEKRYMGLYQFLQPVLLIRDPELIKKITIKEFDSFPDRRSFGKKDVDPLWTRNLLSMTSEDGWHDMRATLSPSFTSSKLRGMFVLMQQCAEQFIAHFQKEGSTIDVEVLDAFTRFANDIIATTAFGVTCDSFTDPENTFFMMGRSASNISGLMTLKFWGHCIFPGLMKLLKVNIYSEEMSSFFRSLIKDTMKMREGNQIVRPDLVHLLMEARKGRLKYDEQSNVLDTGYAVVEESTIGKTLKRPKAELTDDDIVAQALLFFRAGFDSAARVMSYAVYELAVNSDVQDLLHQEVDGTVENCNGKLTYEALLGMKYLDMVISETLRKRPAGVFMERKVARPFTIEPEQPDEEPVHLDAGSIIFLPVYPLHNDHKYYNNPEKFDPERFSEENKHNIRPFTYLPFGSGPRSCIASRFALLETKLIIVEILRKFEIVPIEKTQIPIKLSKKNFFAIPDGGIWLGLKPRKKCL